MEEKYYLLKILWKKSFVNELENFLWENISWGWEEENNTFKIYFASKDLMLDFIRKIKNLFPEISFEIENYKGRDWAEEWRKYFSPIDISDFQIIPSWEEGKCEKEGKIPIYIYPEMAFGTGQHPTTKLCLLALLKLFKTKKIKTSNLFLDVGTGSGILGIGASLLGLKGIGLDIDISILNNCKKNISLNSVNYSFFIGPIYALTQNIRFDIIFANILLEPLIEMRDEFLKRLIRGGYLIVSGILNTQENTLISVYSPFLKKEAILREKEWSSIIWQKE